jgi:hypothetical protein
MEGIWRLRGQRQINTRSAPAAAEYGIAIIDTQLKPAGNINADTTRLIFGGTRGC